MSTYTILRFDAIDFEHIAEQKMFISRSVKEIDEHHELSCYISSVKLIPQQGKVLTFKNRIRRSGSGTYGKWDRGVYKSHVSLSRFNRDTELMEPCRDSEIRVNLGDVAMANDANVYLSAGKNVLNINMSTDDDYVNLSIDADFLHSLGKDMVLEVTLRHTDKLRAMREKYLTHTESPFQITGRRYG